MREELGKAMARKGVTAEEEALSGSGGMFATVEPVST
jgi:hypothetical protein